ncbi:MAG: hypothetical protein PHU03_08110 [Syntrophales bacterium]|nr:hypothetical protein [Syntrophales bacterium]
MLGQARIPGIPTAEEEEKANFKLDDEKSFALLVITPIHAVSDDGETDYIHVDETIEIKPYPNPYGFGGMWGHGSHKPDEEKKVISDFHHWVDPWIERGLTRVEIKHEPKETRRVPTEAQRQAYLNRARNQSSSKRRDGNEVMPGQTPLF